MEKQVNNKEYYSIDSLQIFKILWKRIWLIFFSGVLVALIAFFVSAFAIPPSYSSSIKLYVNNGSSDLGNTNNFSISYSDISAAQSLVKTYGDILVSRSTLERVINKAQLNYSWKELSEMIDCAPSNNTENMRVTVTCGDPHEACRIANTIAEILPVRISEIIDGASMVVVDSAVPELDKVGPSVVKYTAIGFLIGFIISVAIFIISALLDDTIHDEEFILKNYNYPILGKVPNLINAGNKAYGYYSKNHHKANN